MARVLDWFMSHTITWLLVFCLGLAAACVAVILWRAL